MDDFTDTLVYLASLTGDMSVEGICLGDVFQQAYDEIKRCRERDEKLAYICSCLNYDIRMAKEQICAMNDRYEKLIACYNKPLEDLMRYTPKPIMLNCPYYANCELRSKGAEGYE